MQNATTLRKINNKINHDYTQTTRLFDVEVKQKNRYLIKRATAPATTGEATLVPDNERQSPLRFEPNTMEP